MFVPFFEMGDISQPLHQNDVYGCFIAFFSSYTNYDNFSRIS